MRNIETLMKLNSDEMNVLERTRVKRHIRDIFEINMITVGWGDYALSRYDIELEKLYDKV